MILEITLAVLAIWLIGSALITYLAITSNRERNRRR